MKVDHGVAASVWAVIRRRRQRLDYTGSAECQRTQLDGDCSNALGF
jgi:hypothetical protein